MSDYNEQVIKLLNIMKAKPFLFPKGMATKMKFPLYFDWFEKHNKQEFNQMPGMVHFNPDIIDQYSKRIVWTGFAPTGGQGSAYALHTLVQVNKGFHIIFMFAQEDSEASVISTLYLLDINDYINFINDNDKFIMKTKVPVGFSGLGSIGFSQSIEKKD